MATEGFEYVAHPARVLFGSGMASRIGDEVGGSAVRVDDEAGDLPVR